MRIYRREFTLGILAGTATRISRALQPRPKLLVLVVLEQFRQDYLDAADGQFGTEGLRKILSKGAHFPDCRHLASTFSMTSLATLATGAWPAEHGIVADSWWDAAAKGVIPASSESLGATTLMGQLAGDRQNRTYVIGMDAAHAGLFAAGSDARQYWMDADGKFATLGEPQTWMTEFNRLKTPENAHDAKWMAVGAKTGAPPLRKLTFDEAHPEQFVEAWKASPLGQAAQFEFLVTMIEKENLGRGETFDFVCLIASSTSRLGYEVGGRSPLMRQMALELDTQIEFLLKSLNAGQGEAGYTLALAGAHGAPPTPMEASRARMAVQGEGVAQTIDKALAERGMGRVTKYVYPFVYLDTSGFRDPEPLRQFAGRAAMTHPAVAGYYTAGGYCTTRDGWQERFRNSFHVTRSGDLMLSYRPEYVEDYGQGRGVSYGSLYNYDVRVPLCFYGPQFAPVVVETSVRSVDVAPTLARAIGARAPSSSEGRVLGEAFGE